MSLPPTLAPPFVRFEVAGADELLWDVQAAEDLSDEPLLNYYTKEWNRYTTGASYVNRLFTYLNRHWVKREKDEGRKNVYTVYIVRSHLTRSAPWGGGRGRRS